MQLMWKALKKLYLFDGEMQDGFEEESNLEIEEDEKDIQIRALKEFEKRRTGMEEGH